MNTYVLGTKERGGKLRKRFVGKALIPKESIQLTVSRFHDRSHPNTANPPARYTQDFHGFLRPQFLGGVCFGHPDVLTRDEERGKAR